MDCRQCGTCCVAPDIKSLAKPLGVPCPYLDGDNLCSGYEQRPTVCRTYRPDDICLAIAAPTLAGRVENYLKLFGIESCS
jgi:Fe-S-cluster containining protein